jgi:hypothetical protein
MVPQQIPGEGKLLKPPRQGPVIITIYFQYDRVVISLGWNSIYINKAP